MHHVRDFIMHITEQLSTFIGASSKNSVSQTHLWLISKILGFTTKEITKVCVKQSDWIESYEGYTLNGKRVIIKRQRQAMDTT